MPRKSAEAEVSCGDGAAVRFVTLCEGVRRIATRDRAPRPRHQETGPVPTSQGGEWVLVQSRIC